MTDARWERLSELFHDAVALTPEERERFLADACGGDAEMRAQLERLVAAHDRAGGFIELPALASVSTLAGLASDTALSGRRFGPYRIVREIARGGMGAVYLAERADGQFTQQVAIKLIKRGMDTDLVVDRFRAERQILASLDHPNIARLLDGGTTDDGRPYFVMEFIDGVPIDEYADANRLSIRDRLKLFAQVCHAVDYAHRHLVVHRDIKPANVLVTRDGTPKLLDFGIAKVLDPGAGEPTSSMTGFRLLTPEYASPEQIDGRHATPASDVYSLGVVLYELLTGRSPYILTGRDPLHIADVVRTTDPERPSTAISREPTPSTGRRAALETNRAAATGAGSTEKLRKGLRGDIDTLTLAALRREPHRRYASAAALAEDIQRHLDGRPILARSDSVAYRAGKFLRRNRTMVTASALAAAAVLAVSPFALRATRAPDDPSLIRTGTLAARDRLLVADFVDQVHDPQLASALSDAFRVGLTQSPLVQVLSARQVRAALTRMERSPDLAIDDSLAREVAMREGLKAYVVGTVSRVGRQFTVTAQIVSAARGDVLAAMRETAADSDAVIGAVDRLAAAVRHRIGESLPSIQSMPALERVTTPSLAALSDFTEGVRRTNNADRTAGLRYLEHAVMLDTGFASAYRSMAITYGEIGDPGRSAAAMEHAMANQGRLSLYERYVLVAAKAASDEDYDAAIAAYRQLLSRYPDDFRTINNMAFVYAARRRWAEAESLLMRAAALDSTLPSIHMSLASVQMEHGDYVGSRRSLDWVKAHAPNFFNLNLGEIYLAAAQQDWPAAERLARHRLTVRPSDSLDAIGGNEVLAEIVMTRGRFAEAERIAQKALLLSTRLNAPSDYLFTSLVLATSRLRRGDPVAALAIVDSTLRRYPIDSLAVGDRPFDALARFYAAAGKPATARQFLDAASRSPLIRVRHESGERHWSRGVLALAEGRVPESLAELRLASDSLECEICALPDLARAFEASGQIDSAIVTYRRYVTGPWKWRFEPDATELGIALERLGELAARRGDSTTSIDAYKRLTDLWSQGDPEVRARLRTLARLH